MKNLFLIFIKIYWLIVPKNKRRSCIFKISCSNYVYQTVKNDGFLKGIVAFQFRYQNCRTGFQLHENHMDKCLIMILRNGQKLEEKDISDRFINK